MDDIYIENIDVLNGDYKVAVDKMSWPLIISMLISLTYYLIDCVWISTLGAESLAAVGFVSPLVMIVNSFANGIGSAASSFIGRKIGGGRKDLADLEASQAIIVGIIFPIIVTLFVLLFQEPLLALGGAKGEVLSLAVQYSTILFSGCIFIIITNVLSGILRAEGNVKKALHIMFLTSLINTILDPIFMFSWGLNLGIAGVAYATVISAAIGTFVLIYWIFIKRNTYLSIKKEDFKFNFPIIKKILKIGLISSLEFISIAVLFGMVNSFLAAISDTYAIATYTAGMRVILLGIVSSVGLSMGTLLVASSSVGAAKYRRLKDVLNYSTKFGIFLAIIIGSVLFIFADYIALLFSFSSNTASLVKPIADFIRIFFLFLIASPLGLISGAIFSSLGMGREALGFCLIREILFPAIFMILFLIVFPFGVWDVWFGIVVGKLVGAIISWLYSSYYTDKIIDEFGEIGDPIYEKVV